MDSYYECKRCLYKCKQKNDMKRHLNKKKKCENINDCNLNDNDIEKISLVKIYLSNGSKSKYNCIYCNKNFVNNSTLKNHINKNCKFKELNIDKNDFIKVEKKECLEKNDEKKNNDEKNNVNIINNITNITNITNINNIDININIIKSFDEDWDVTKINDELKLILLLNNSKFTSTLENILENEVNLNVIMDKHSENGIIYENNVLKEMNVKDILKRSMEKLYKQLCNFHDDIINPNIFNVNESILDVELDNAKKKLMEYNKDDKTRNEVDKYITEIYSKKKDNTKEIKNIKDS